MAIDIIMSFYFTIVSFLFLAVTIILINLFYLLFISIRHNLQTFMFYFAFNVDLLVLCYIYKFSFYLPVIHQFISFIVIQLFYLPFYKSCVSFPKFIFYFTISIDLLSFMLYLQFFVLFTNNTIICQFILIYLFYLSFTSLMFYFQNLCFVQGLMLIYQFYVIFINFYFIYQ